MTLDRFQHPDGKYDLLIHWDTERLPTIGRVSRMKELFFKGIGNDGGRCGHIEFIDATKVALAYGDDMIRRVKDAFDLSPPVLVLER